MHQFTGSLEVWICMCLLRHHYCPDCGKYGGNLGLWCQSGIGGLQTALFVAGIKKDMYLHIHKLAVKYSCNLEILKYNGGISNYNGKKIKEADMSTDNDWF